MDQTSIFILLAIVGAVGGGWYLWTGPARRRSEPAPPPRVEEPDEEEEQAPEPERPPGSIPIPDLKNPKIAAADALVYRWYVERLGGPRGLDKAARDAAMGPLMREQNLTPGMAAMATYDDYCRKRRLTPKRPPAAVRTAVETLGLKR